MKDRIAAIWLGLFYSLNRCLGLLIVTLFCLATASPAKADETWKDLRYDLFGDRPIQEDKRIGLEAPMRADDAAIVPIDIKLFGPKTAGSGFKSVTLVIDENPAPVAAVFQMEPQSAIASISTRVRVNAYSYIRAIAETTDGQLFMAAKFVKASGGCSSPAVKDRADAMANLGKMRLRQYSANLGHSKPYTPIRSYDVQLMIRHPNHSGLQMDQLTRHYVPAHFVRDITIMQDDTVVLSIEGAISLSEDPAIRFQFQTTNFKPITAKVVDTEDLVFTGSWALNKFNDAGF